MFEDQSFINIPENALVQAAQQFVLEQFNEQHDARLVYHNYYQTNALVERVGIIGAEEQTEDTALEIAILAAWFLNIGYLEDPKKPISKSIQQATRFLEINNYVAANQDRVVDCLKMVDKNSVPTNLEQQLLMDAIRGEHLQMYEADQGALFRLEEELLQSRRYTNLEWAQLQLQRLMQMVFYLPSSKRQSEPIVAKHILLQKQLVEKESTPRYTEEMLDGKLRKFQSIERKMPTSAIQTFFRTNYRNHINLSAIADNKANIMISVNAIIISVLISLLSYGNVMETRPMVLMPVVIFLISGLTSLIFAVLSARPKVTSLNNSDTNLDVAQRNIVFFGNFVTLELEQYEEAMDAMFRNSELIYGNMTRDLYYLGKVLDQKYRYLTISYTVFMIGFAATVITFLVAILN